MEKKQFKEKVLKFLEDNNVDIGNRKVRVYDSRRYGLEVRIYNGAMEIPNTKKSHRKMSEPTDEYNSTYGIHSTKVNTYTHINESDLDNESEKDFILDMLKYN